MKVTEFGKAARETSRQQPQRPTDEALPQVLPDGLSWWVSMQLRPRETWDSYRAGRGLKSDGKLSHYERFE